MRTAKEGGVDEGKWGWQRKVRLSKESEVGKGKLD